MYAPVQDKFIRENELQLKYLKAQIVKSDYKHAQGRKFMVRENGLLQKQKDRQMMLRMEALAQEESQRRKQADSQIKHSLAKQYLDAMNHRKIVKTKEKEQEAAEQRRTDLYSFLYEEQQHRQEQLQKEQQRQVLKSQLDEKMEKLKREREQQQLQNELLRKQAQRNRTEGSVKQHNYREYFRKFQQQQNALVERKAVDPREAAKRELINLSEKQSDLLFRNHDEVDRRRRTEQQSVLQQLQRQVKLKDMKEEELRRVREQEVSRQQLEQKRLEQRELWEKVQKREGMRRYESELSKQLEKSKSQPKDQSSFIPEIRQLHNPITNPIDFRMDPCNRYLVREYENAKERVVGSPYLRLGNLASIGRLVTQH